MIQVVYIDDDHLNFKLVSKILKTRSDIKLHCAIDTQSGTKLIETINPDVALVDINLTDSNGYQIARYIRQKPELNGVNLIALTANLNNRYACFDAGFDDYISKPISRSLLIYILDKYVYPAYLS